MSSKEASQRPKKHPFLARQVGLQDFPMFAKRSRACTSMPRTDDPAVSLGRAEQGSEGEGATGASTE